MNKELQKTKKEGNEFFKALYAIFRYIFIVSSIIVIFIIVCIFWVLSLTTYLYSRFAKEKLIKLLKEQIAKLKA